MTEQTMTGPTALPPHARPFDPTPRHTPDLPPTPQRSYRIPAEAWIEAPAELLSLGADLTEPVEYKRRIGGWLLWRAGPPVGRSRYMAVSDDGQTAFIFELHGKTGRGRGPDGAEHQRFRTWKEALRDNDPPATEGET